MYSPSGGYGAGCGMADKGGWNYITSANKWYYVTLSCDRTYMHLDVNNGLFDQTISYGNVAPANGNARLNLFTMWGGTPYSFFNGSLGEFWFSNVVRSNAWRSANYQSQQDNLVTYGSVETITPPPPVTTYTVVVSATTGQTTRRQRPTPLILGTPSRSQRIHSQVISLQAGRLMGQMPGQL